MTRPPTESPSTGSSFADHGSVSPAGGVAIGRPAWTVIGVYGGRPRPLTVRVFVPSPAARHPSPEPFPTAH